MSEFFQWQDDDLIIACHLQPKASKTEVVGLHGDALKVRIKAAPVEGKANAELIRFLAKEFAVSKRDVVLISGELSRQKRIRISAPKVIPDYIKA